MTTYVGKWDCSYCRTGGIDGYVYICPGCSHPRARNVRFYLPSDAPEATPEQIKLMGNDPNWYCEHCDSGNLDSNSSCWNCGAEKGASPSHEVRKYQPGQVPRSEEEVEDDDDEGEYQDPIHRAPWPLYIEVEEEDNYDAVIDSLPKRPLMIGFTLFALAVLGVLLYQFFFNTREVDAYVKAFSWQRSVAIEEYRTVDDQGWSVPAGGRTKRTETRQNGTRRVSDGYHTEYYTDTCYRTESVPSTCYRSVYHSQTCTRDNGNGSFSTYECGSSETESYSCMESQSVSYSCTNTRQVEAFHYEPVYDTWYFYEIERWIAIGVYPTSGDDHDPFYDPVKTTADNQRRVENIGRYTTYFVCDELGDFDREFDLEAWEKQFVGQKYVVTTNFAKIVMAVEPIE